MKQTTISKALPALRIVCQHPLYLPGYADQYAVCNLLTDSNNVQYVYGVGHPAAQQAMQTCNGAEAMQQCAEASIYKAQPAAPGAEAMQQYAEPVTICAQHMQHGAKPGKTFAKASGDYAML